MLEELQVPTGDGQPRASIVESLKSSTSRFDVTAIESSSDYLVNGKDVPSVWGPAVVASGTQTWPANRLTRHADHQLGPATVSEPTWNFVQIMQVLCEAHTAPLKHGCTANWVMNALQHTSAPNCNAHKSGSSGSRTNPPGGNSGGAITPSSSAPVPPSISPSISPSNIASPTRTYSDLNARR